MRSGSAEAVVVSTGRSTRFGEIAAGLGEQQPRTDFQRGLGSVLRPVGQGRRRPHSRDPGRQRRSRSPLIDAVLFSLAIVGITPQLLPAVVSMSLATGSRRLVERAKFW